MGTVVLVKVIVALVGGIFGYSIRRSSQRDKSAAASKALSSGAIFAMFVSVSSDPAYGGQFMYNLYPPGVSGGPACGDQNVPLWCARAIAVLSDMSPTCSILHALTGRTRRPSHHRVLRRVSDHHLPSMFLHAGIR